MNFILKLFSVFIVITSSLSAMEGFPVQGSRKRTLDKSEQQETKKQKIEPQDITLICKDNQNNYHSIKTTKQIIDLSTTLSELYQEAKEEKNNNPIKELNCASLHRHVHELVSIINLLTDMYHQYENKSYTYEQFQKAMKQPTNEDVVRWFNDFKQQIWSALKSEQDSEEFRKLIKQLDIPLISELLNCCIYEQKTGLPYILGFDVGANVMEELVYSGPLIEKIKPYFLDMLPEYHNQLVKQLTDSNEKIEYSPGYSKGVQIIENPDLSHSIVRVLDFKKKLIQDISLDQFKNLSKEDRYIVWSDTGHMFSLLQENNGYIIFTDSRTPIFIPNIKHIRFSAQGNFAIIENLQNKEKLFCLKNKEYLYYDGIHAVDGCIVLSSDERYAMIESEIKRENAETLYTLKVYDLHKKIQIFEQENVLFHKLFPTAHCISIKLQDSLLVYDLKKQKVCFTHESNEKEIQISPDGKFMTVGDKVLLEIDKKSKGNILPPHYSVLYSNNKQTWHPQHPHALLVKFSTDQEKYVTVVDIEKNTLITPKFYDVEEINYSNTGKYLTIIRKDSDSFFASDALIEIWDVQDNSSLLKLSTVRPIQVAWSEDNQFFAYKSNNAKSIVIFNFHNKKYIEIAIPSGASWDFMKNSHILGVRYGKNTRFLPYSLDNLNNLINELHYNPQLYTLVGAIENAKKPTIPYEFLPRDIEIMKRSPFIAAVIYNKYKIFVLKPINYDFNV